MKKVIFACLIGLLAVSCNTFQSVETPIEGTDLVTYTAKDTKLLGIKAPGTETTITGPLYIKAEGKYGYIIAQLTYDPTTWHLLDGTGKVVTGTSYARILFTRDFFVLEKSSSEKYFLKNGADAPLGPIADYVYNDGKVFFQNDGKWGLDGLLSPEWEKIIILQQADGKDLRYVVKVPGKKQWKIYSSAGKFIKNTTAAQVSLMEKNANSKKYADKQWGKDGAKGLTVANVKAY